MATTTTPAAEAAAILERVFEALARASGKTLNTRTRADITRACELLSQSGEHYEQLLDDAPRATPGERAASYVEAAQADPKYQEWKRQRDRGEA